MSQTMETAVENGLKIRDANEELQSIKMDQKNMMGLNNKTE